jgi:N-acetylmuramoyl-L-alanine amidase
MFAACIGSASLRKGIMMRNLWGIGIGGLTALWRALAVLCLMVAPATAKNPVALDMRIAGDDMATRIVIEFDRPVEFTRKLLGNPWRLVLDFDKIGYGFKTDAASRTGIVSGVRIGDMSAKNSRMIFEASQPFAVKDILARNDAETGHHSLVIDLEVTDAKDFAEALDRSLMTSSVINTAQKRDRLGARRGNDDVFTIVLDPGHGGIDNGARGVLGSMEKNLTLEFAKDLEAELKRFPGAEVFMTRDSDVFVSLNDRTGFARLHEADLFISIHADFLRQRSVRGATIYTISEKASDAVAETLAQDQNLADSVAGLEVEEDETGVTDILVDLARRETLGFSVQFARLAVSDMKGFARLIKNPHRYAGFKVLKAPDVPSVLIELGYLSNKEDEKLMNDVQWREALAERLASSIEKFAALSSKRLAAGDGSN